MIIVMEPSAKKEQIDALLEKIQKFSVTAHVSQGTGRMIIGLIGDTYSIDQNKLQVHPGVDRVMRVQEPFKQANRKLHPQNSVIKIGNVDVGDGSLRVLAGPCAVESREQIIETAQSIKAAGADILRGGAFKPRTSPYSFQGLGQEGLELLCEAREKTGLPFVTEIISPKHVGLFEGLVDGVQIGARNMQNFDLLKEVGRLSVPVVLKRGISSTIEEWLMSAEYIMSQGNHNVILCERGIRTFEPYTRNTLDLSAIPLVKKLSHLPIVVDPSHATGNAALVAPLALAAVAAGADGLMIEVHPDPKSALSDGPQSLQPEPFAHLMRQIASLHRSLRHLTV
ncbi:MAG: 3-deoxy-7-phosphoheptulonate synthase [Christensenellales bacterium]